MSHLKLIPAASAIALLTGCATTGYQQEIEITVELTTNPMEATKKSRTAITHISIDWPQVPLSAPHAQRHLLMTGEQA